MENIRTVLVTGGAGYIGSHTLLELREAGYQPVVFDNFSAGHRAAVPADVPIVEGDLADASSLLEALQKFRPEAVIHFAAFIEAGESMKEPSRFYYNNVVNTLHLLEAMRASGVMKLVFSSSAGVYGQPEKIPIKETTPTLPVNTYGQTKLMIERILADYSRAYGLDAIALRYFNACGAHRSSLIGEAHPKKTHLIELALLTVLGQYPHLSVFGIDYPTPDGSAIRDYIHVADLASAHVLSLSALRQASGFRAYNVGVGTGFSVLDVVRAVEDVTGAKLPVRYAPRREGDPAALVADASAIREALGWEPRFIRLEDMVASAWAWHRTHPSGFEA